VERAALACAVRGAWVTQARRWGADGVGRLRGPPGGSGEVEVRWADMAVGTAAVASLVEVPAGHGGLHTAPE
jgi:hypothetical protein